MIRKLYETQDLAFYVEDEPFTVDGIGYDPLNDDSGDVPILNIKNDHSQAICNSYCTTRKGLVWSVVMSGMGKYRR